MPIIEDRDCSGATLAPDSSTTVQALIDTILDACRQICGDIGFRAEFRLDGRIKIVPRFDPKPVVGENLATLWPGKRSLAWDVRSQSDAVAGRRPFDHGTLPELHRRLSERFAAMSG